ncbi:FAD/NAD(P)-binding protein [Blastococcus sp. PRF04-17]|uniref:FAD/NAD(P)-binding protein n=1 Tax=Blastococcus sp. PRF04-17 TaxID=2933797 RepID=UPI001FF54264|nr:FAD/NAD(P)-binding protein [Blastococcus sp. PRF04-17]UOY03322.1 FAD/NAD(P)-binding protein [Blastococcus sp. PRF04-17]
MRDPEVLVVGAGPHGLAAVSYLLAADPSLAGRLAVADSDPWLAGWDARFSSLELTTLRSACVHHPHPEPYALLDWASAAGRSGHFSGPVGAPDTTLFADFCRSLVARHDLERARIALRVTGLHPRDDGRVDVELPGRRLRVRRVVLAAGGGRPHVPVPGGVHSGSVDLSAVRAGQAVVVVGGGLTAAHLARRAALRGAHVVLVPRAPLRSRLMDVDAVWLGTELPGFFARPAADRAALVRTARPGTVPPAVRDAVHVDPRVRIRLGRLHRVSAGRAHLADGEDLHADHVWLATGYSFDVRRHRLTAGLLQEAPVEVVDGLPVLTASLSWGGTSVHVSGGLAAMGIGPAARGLAGARMAAERYTEAITGLATGRRQYPVPETAPPEAMPAQPPGLRPAATSLHAGKQKTPSTPWTTS